MGRGRRALAVAALGGVTLGLLAIAGPAREGEASVPSASTLARPPVARTQEHRVTRLIVGTRGGAVPDAAFRTAVAALDGGRPAGVVRRLGHGQTLLGLGASLTPSDAWRVARALSRQRGITFVEPDLWVTPTATPNDPLFSQQWDLTGTYGVNSAAAWARTTGRSSVVVAVLDTGLTVHPDVTSSVVNPTATDQIVKGYDFVSGDGVGGASPYYTANDGNGRDADPSDPGDWITAAESAGTDPVSGTFFQNCPQSTSSWHGTHVTGTVVATQNNGIGVSGLAPGVKVQPIRVLGRCGGYASDITDAIEWASGGAVAGVPANATPAAVISLSLGGAGACLASTQTAINDARSRGAAVVVAAGNSAAAIMPSGSSQGSQPADCQHVIDVVATTSAGSVAAYSNYGPAATGSTVIAAPGGAATANGDNILSTINLGATVPTTPGYATYAGTSMATPHVASAAALLQSLVPDSARLTPDQVAARLAASLTTPSGCPIVAGCGHLLDLGAAGVLPSAAPSAPTAVIAQPGVRQIALSWTAPTFTSGLPVTYSVQQSAAGSAYVQLATGLTSPSYVAGGLSPGTAYTYLVTAANSAGTSGPSTATSGVSPLFSYLFLVENPSGTNEVRHYRINGDGTTTLIGAYSTGHPGGTSSWLVAPRAAVASATGHLYALNLGDQTVSVFALNAANGALTLQATTASLHATSIAVNPAGTVLLAGGASAAGSADQLAAYPLAADGSVTATPVSTVSASVDGLAVSPDGTQVATAGPGSGPTWPGGIALFGLDATGHLTATSTVQQTCPTGVTYGASTSVLFSAACYLGSVGSYNVAGGVASLTGTTAASALPASSQTVAVGPDGTAWFSTSMGLQGAVISGPAAGPASFVLGPATPVAQTQPLATLAVAPDGSGIYAAGFASGLLSHYAVGSARTLTLSESLTSGAGLPTLVAYAHS